MYFLLISYGIISFFYSKMFLLFPEAAMKLFNIPLLIMLEGVVYFKVGNLCGMLLSIFRLPLRRFIVIILYLIFILNTIFLLRLYHIYDFYLADLTFFYVFRFITGLNVYILLSLYTQFIGRFMPTQHNKLITILFNNSVFVLPVWNLLYHYLNMESIFVLLNVLVFCNLLYFAINKKYICKLIESGKEQADQVLYPEVILNRAIVHRTYKVYLKYSLFIGLLLSFLMTILLLNTHIRVTGNESPFIRFLYENIPYILSIIIFLLHKYIKPQWLFIFIIQLGLVNLLITYGFGMKVSMLILVNTGLIYGLYLVITSIFIAKIKEATKDLFYYGSLIFYILKTITTGLLMKIFGKHLASSMLLSPSYYNIYFVFIMIILFISYIRFINCTDR